MACAGTPFQPFTLGCHRQSSEQRAIVAVAVQSGVIAWQRTSRGTATSVSEASSRPRRWGKSSGRSAVERLASLWIRRNVESSNRYVGKRAADSTQWPNVIPLRDVIPKMPFIVGIRPEKRSKGLDRLQCCWHVLYQFCGLSAEIIVHAQSEAEARVNAVDELRARGLKVVLLENSRHPC